MLQSGLQSVSPLSSTSTHYSGEIPKSIPCPTIAPTQHRGSEPRQVLRCWPAAKLHLGWGGLSGFLQPATNNKHTGASEPERGRHFLLLPFSFWSSLPLVHAGTHQGCAYTETVTDGLLQALQPAPALPGPPLGPYKRQLLHTPGTRVPCSHQQVCSSPLRSIQTASYRQHLYGDYIPELGSRNKPPN